MKLWGRRRKRQQQGSSIPAHLEIFFRNDPDLPHPDAILGIYDDEPEISGPPPSIEELLQDPDVRAVVEASQCLDPLALKAGKGP